MAAVNWFGKSWSSWNALRGELQRRGINPDVWRQAHPAAMSQFTGRGGAGAPVPAAQGGGMIQPGGIPEGPTQGSLIPGLATSYGPEMTLAEQAYAQAKLQLGQQQAQTRLQLGLAPGGGGPSGLLPYGAYQQNRRAAALEREGLLGQSVARGLGAGGGLAGQAQARANFQRGAEMAGILGAGVQAGAQYEGGVAEAGRARDLAIFQAKQGAAREAIQAGAFSQAPNVPIPYESFGGGGTVAPAAKAGTGSAVKPLAGVQWGGQTFNTRTALASWLKARGANINQWAQAHPEAYSRLR